MRENEIVASLVGSEMCIRDSRARLSAYLMLSARGSRIEVTFHRRDGHVVPARLSLASFGDGYASLLVSELSMPHRLDEIDGSLNAIRDALEILNRLAAEDARGKQAVQAIGREINSLARLADEMREQDPTEEQ